MNGEKALNGCLLGSQNGYDNSGQRTSDPLWGVTPQNVSRTLDLLGYLAADVGSSGMVDGIELLNEPAGFLQGVWPATISRFWQGGYDVVRDVVPGGNITVVIEDGFLGVQSWEGFLNAASGAINVLMDTHVYQIFNNTQLGFTWDEHINVSAFQRKQITGCQLNLCTTVQTACQAGPPLASFTRSGNIWTIIGEWSTAPTDCAMWLNGRNVGARWDGTYLGQTQVFGNCSGLTGDSSEFSESYKTFLRQ